MKDKIFSYTKNRKLWVNIVVAILCFLGMFLVPSLIAILFNLKIKNLQVCTIIGDLIYILLIYLVYKKDLDSEAKIYFSDFKNKFKYGFKIYILGYFGMIFFNLFITLFLKDISQNESQVRELLYSNAVTTMISISILAPLLEELIFRKTIGTIIKNKWIYVIISGLLFGGAHILTNIMNNSFAITDLLYVLPYGCLGGAFALMDYNTKTTFTSIVFHALHNTFTAILLLITFFGGK